MSSYDDWNKVDEEDNDELQGNSIYESKRDVILFCIDCSESMLALYEDPKYENAQTCHLLTALEVAVEIEKRKITVAPNDSVGIILFNTSRKHDTERTHGTEIKKGNFLLQPISPLSAPTVQEIIQIIDSAREDPNYLRETYPPAKGPYVPLGDVFTSCNWVLRDGAPKTATKRVFLITNEDYPLPKGGSQQLVTSARTTLIDLAQAGVAVEPFFIKTEDKPFDVQKFYASVLPSTTFEDDEATDSNMLPESISISRIDDLLAQMKFHELAKRSLFSVPLHLSKGLTIGVKGYGLITEQKKGAYRYFQEGDNETEAAITRTTYMDPGREEEVDKATIKYGAELGESVPVNNGGEDEAARSNLGVRNVQLGRRPFYTSEEVKGFRTFGLEPAITLLGFRNRDFLEFELNVKHSTFIYPDEMTFSGSRRAFIALVESMLKKDKIALVLALTRRNSSPVFCALLPQKERRDEDGWLEPSGLHLIPIPFADDIRAAPIEEGFRAAGDLVETAAALTAKLTIKNGGYEPDTYPNPALAFHNEQIQATAFQEEYDPDAFEDFTLPKVDGIHKRGGALMKQWHAELKEDNSASFEIPIAAGSKRKAEAGIEEAEIRSRYENGTINKLTVEQLKGFLRAKGIAVSGKKADLIDRAAQWFESH